MIARRFFSLTGILICLLATQLAARPTSRPTTNPSSAEDQALGGQLIRGDDVTAKSPAARSGGTTVGTSGALDLLRIVIALAIVIGVILILRTVIGNLGKLPGSRRSGKLVSVISRSIISAKQQVLVLQVGRRLIVVGDSSGQMNALCEISDPDEIAELIGHSRQEQQAQSERPAGSFGNLFRRANEPFSDGELSKMQTEDAPKTVEPVDGVTSEDVRGLLDKVRMLQQQFKH